MRRHLASLLTPSRSTPTRAWRVLISLLVLLPVGLLGGVGGSRVLVHTCEGLGVHLHARDSAVSSSDPHGHAHAPVSDQKPGLAIRGASNHAHPLARDCDHGRPDVRECPDAPSAALHACTPGFCGTIGVLISIPNLQRHAEWVIDLPTVFVHPVVWPFRPCGDHEAAARAARDRPWTGPPLGRSDVSATQRLVRVSLALLI